MSENQNWAALLQHIEDTMPRFEELAPASFQHFADGLEINENIKEISAKTRELIALAVGAALHCDGCIAYHVHGAKKAGATKQEVAAAMATAMTIGSGSKYIQSIYVLDAYDQIEVEEEEKEGEEEKKKEAAAAAFPNEIREKQSMPDGTRHIEDGYPFDLGTYSRPIPTKSEDAQRWFDRGLNWCFGYNHDEAVVCFKKALDFDPKCAMIHWGIAYAAGPNYNLPWDFFNEEQLVGSLNACLDELDKAKACLTSDSPELERLLIDALYKRYQSRNAVSLETLYKWAGDFSAEMEKIYEKYPDDFEVVCWFAESLMNKSPWKLWDPRTGEPVAAANPYKIKEVLERGIEKGRSIGLTHPGIWHLYIHTMEMSPTPEIALRVGDELRHLVPDAGHLAHMPTHIDIQCGNYLDVVDSNQAAIEEDLKFYHYAGAKNFYSLYRCHNYHFKMYGAMFLGQYEAAIGSARQMQETVGDQVMTADMAAMQGWFEAYFSLKTHAFVRFGKWQEAIDDRLPENPDIYKVTTAMTYYGRAIGHANLKQDVKARENQAKFLECCEKIEPERVLHVIPIHLILNVGKEMLAGEIEYHAGNIEKGFGHLRKAVELEDNLPYDEPWPWMMPCRHALGALLLDQNRAEEAAACYEADLGFNDEVVRANRHPNNVWALIGLHDAYTRLGRKEDARKIKPNLDFAKARADVDIKASCFCSKKCCAAAA